MLSFSMFSMRRFALPLIILGSALSLQACLPAERPPETEVQATAHDVVDLDLQMRLQKWHVTTPGYTLRSIGESKPGSHGGQSLDIALVPDNGVLETLVLPVTYEYRADSEGRVFIVYRPKERELQAALIKAWRDAGGTSSQAPPGAL